MIFSYLKSLSKRIIVALCFQFSYRLCICLIENKNFSTVHCRNLIAITRVTQRKYMHYVFMYNNMQYLLVLCTVASMNLSKTSHLGNCFYGFFQLLNRLNNLIGMLISAPFPLVWQQSEMPLIHGQVIKWTNLWHVHASHSDNLILLRLNLLYLVVLLFFRL